MNAKSIPRERVVVTRETTGERLTRLRMARGWSQRRLATESGVCPRSILRAEQNGRVFADTLESLARALDVRPGYLFDGRGEP